MSVPDLKQELVTLLESPLAPVKVHYARPLKLTGEYEVVWINGVARWNRGGGEQWREEVGGLEVGIDVFKPGDDPVAADARRWELIDLIDAALVDADFGGYRDQGVLTQRVGDLEGYENGWLAHSIMEISTNEEID